MSNPLQIFETKLLGNLRYTRAKWLTDKRLEEITLELVREVRDVVIPYYVAKAKEQGLDKS